MKLEQLKERIETDKLIIDVCCGSKMFWFDKNNPLVEFCDKREVPYHEFYPNRYIEVKPNTICDFKELPFADNSFKLAVFDPPHLTQVGDTSWTYLKYGRLPIDWQAEIKKGFDECMRVLDMYGVLIFKWSEVQISLREVLKILGVKPLFGHKSGKKSKTHWLCFMKTEQEIDKQRTIFDLMEDKTNETLQRPLSKLQEV